MKAAAEALDVDFVESPRLPFKTSETMLAVPKTSARSF